jgi:hypothetical protein
MKTATLSLLFALSACALANAAEAFRMSLKDDALGALPAGWTAAKTGQGPGSVWQVVEDATAPGGRALAQTSSAGPKHFFNLCVADASSFTDLDISVAMKAIAGKNDQGGGLVWRYKDADNYYVARMNPLEDNYRVYKLVAGKRIQLGSVNMKAQAGQWLHLRVVQQGNHIQCFFDGKLHLDVKDETFKEAGKVGLWSKSDAQTRFAGLEVKGQ